ncbi:hypothetical protein GCM10007933_43350 [Zoogloea oryzae]|uniref:Uncharacterized protein n=1 Tax=Zoogloea oryzae TaxID=310767 RepID=A0ABQ6FGQ6_9RHOO|nr:hypothetical protein GCM10007933_43350 [Zoogloea oryzae]
MDEMKWEVNTSSFCAQIGIPHITIEFELQSVMWNTFLLANLSICTFLNEICSLVSVRRIMKEVIPYPFSVQIGV